MKIGKIIEKMENHLPGLIVWAFISMIIITVPIVLGKGLDLDNHQPLLSNHSIVEMKDKGIGDNLINARIKAEDGAYEISDETILELKKHNLSDGTIKLMIEKNSANKQ